ncbi:transmembrane protein 202 isoform X2 [Callithrix jacchus]
MEQREHLTLTFHSPEVPKIKGDRKYQRPTLPANKDPSALMSSQRRQQHVDQAHIYIRMLCGSLCSFSLLMLIGMSPLNWVQFLVNRNGLELYAGLWTLCNHELCWSHTPKPPYYLQYSRAFFLISIFTILIGLGWLFSSGLPSRRSMTTNLDLKVSMLSFISGIVFLLNYFTSRSPTHDESITVIPTVRPRLGYGPVTTVSPAKNEGPRSKMKSLNVRQKNLPKAGL